MSQISAAPAGGGPAFAAYTDTDPTTIPINAWTKVLLPDELFDTNGQYSASRFTPLKAGKYLFTAVIAFGSCEDLKQYQMYIYKNGVADQRLFNSLASGTGGLTMAGSCIVEANGTTDYFELYVRHNSVSAINLDEGSDETIFSGAFLRS